MYYYPHHIGDFIADTARLTDSQCMAYLRLIWHYYDTEKPLENDPESLAFKIGSSAQDVGLILKHYFILDGDVWRKSRCDNVISEYHSKADKARKAAEIKWKNARAKQADSERNANASENNANASKNDANQKPITDNQKPIEDQKTITPQAAEPAAPEKPAKAIPELDYSNWPSMPEKQTMIDWHAMRKRMKANVSQTVINRFAPELRKAASFGYTVDQCLAECVTRNWRGFEAQWLLNSKQPNGANHAGQPKSAVERFMQQHYPNARTGETPQEHRRPMGGDAGNVRGVVVEVVRGDGGLYEPMEPDLGGG